MIGDLVFPIVRTARIGGWIAKTCIARGGISEETRGRRNLARVQRRRSRQHSRHRSQR